MATTPRGGCDRCPTSSATAKEYSGRSSASMPGGSGDRIVQAAATGQTTVFRPLGRPEAAMTSLPAVLLPQFLGWLVGGEDVEASRQFIVALVVLLILVASAPAGRRRLARGPVVLLLLCPLPGLFAVLFPLAEQAGRLAHYAVRFLALASLLQSLLLIVLVSVWERIGRPMPKIFLDVLRIVMVGVALLAVLFEAGVAAGELFTGSAVLTAVLGFALKDTLGNVFAGLAIHAENPFELGDWIQYDTNPAHIGKVVEINWRATKVITLDEAHVIIPNGQLAQASIRNFTKPEPWSRRSLFVIAPYEVPPQRAQAIMLEAIRGSFGVLEHPAPSVVTNDYKDRGVEYWVRLFTTDFDKRDRVDGMARDRIYYALARHGIQMPVATHQVRLTQLPSPPEVSAETRLAERVSRLEAAGLLGVLPADQLRRLAARDTERVYAAHEPIIRQGDAGSSMFVLLQGRVEVTVMEDGTGPLTLRQLLGGDYFGEMSLLTGAPRTATVTALEETRVLEIGHDAFREILLEHPELVEMLGAELQRRLAEREQVIEGASRTTPSHSDMLESLREFFGL
jgi:small-conductance mechanosensitive channel/CRP-like cAMP-binding protein